MAKKINNAFTIVELLVAMSLLVILLALSGVVFDTTVKAHRAAGATIDVTRNLRAITDQLNADLRGLQKDAPLAIWFELDSANGQRYDQIQFFADGDFQTTKQYDTDGDMIPDTTVQGNMARVYYGHGWVMDVSASSLNKGYREFSTVNGDAVDLDSSSILARRTHLFSQDPILPPYLNGVNPPFPNVDWATTSFVSFLPVLNNYYEYDQLITLNQWKQLLTIQANCDEYLATCFNNTVPPGDNTITGRIGRPVIDMGGINFLHNLLSQGVMQMRIQWAYTADDLVVPNLFNGIRWWPSVDPDADGNQIDSDFSGMGQDQFGICLELPKGITDSIANWFMVNSDTLTNRCKTWGVYFRQDFYPKALKFTFTLKDSNGLFADGKTFTHIVYIDN